MKIVICSRSQVFCMSQLIKPTHVLRLIDPRNTVSIHPCVPIKNCLLLKFEDKFKAWEHNAPKEADVKQILDWGKKLPTDVLLLAHCEAGVSRSTAASLSLLVQYYGNDKIDECIDMLNAIRPQAIMNEVIIDYADSLLSCNGELLQKVKQYNSTKEFYLLIKNGFSNDE